MPLSETVLVIMALLAAGIAASGLFRKLPVPYTVVLVLIGMALAEISERWAPLAPLQQFQLTPDLVLFVFLPALIFESGLNLNARQLIKDIAPVLMLAVPALLFSTLLIGCALWLLLPIGFVVALLFGALISATDPVAVIALFKELGTPERLTVLVEGESLLNDATAIVLVGILLSLTAVAGLSWAVAGAAVLQFFTVFFGGLLVGAVFGLFISWLMPKFAGDTSAVLVLSLVLAYLSFVLAEHVLHVSGVMAVVACAVVLGVLGLPRLSHDSIDVLHETWEFLAHICNTLLFLFVGLLVDLGSLLGDLGIILFAVAVVQLARASMVYSLVPLTVRLFHLPRVTLGERHIMFWGGLKGGLAIAIVLMLPVDLPGREQLINLTLGVVLFTLLVNATSIRPLIRRLGLDRLSDDERAEVRRGLVDARHGMDNMLQRFSDAGLLGEDNRRAIERRNAERLARWTPQVVEADDLRFLQLNALRAELDELDELYRAGVVKPYRWLDLRGELQRKHDHVVAEARYGQAHVGKSRNLFLRLEDALVSTLREKDWAAGLMMRYQNARLAGHMMRDIARILMAEAALRGIRDERGISDAHRRQLEAIYHGHLDYFRGNLKSLAANFPELMQNFETRVSERVTLVAALREVEEAHHCGLITTKAFMHLQARLNQAIAGIPTLTEGLHAYQPAALVARLPLFDGASQAALDNIAARAVPVNYLAGDTIIATGDHGDALYIIARGVVGVWSGQASARTQVAELGPTEFFGEMALLGDHTRKADVIALTSCTLLRISRRDILEIADQYHEIRARLDQASAQRGDNNNGEPT